MLVASNITMQFGAKPLFENVSVKFGEGFRYGLIGANGSGKSTFMKIIAGELEPSAGNISKDAHERMAFLRQDQFAYEDQRVIDVVMMGHQEMWACMQEKDAIYMNPEATEEDYLHAAELEHHFAEFGGYTAEARAGELLLGVGIPSEQHYGPMSEVAPGWKLRVLLTQALFADPDILLLDEPTNNLDIATIRWLENVLNDRNSTMIIISHDRHFLNQVCTHMADLDYGKITVYPGNYDDFMEASSMARQQQKNANDRAKERIAELQDFVRRFSANKSKAKQATSRMKLIDKLKPEDVKPSSRQYPWIRFDYDEKQKLHRQAVEIENLSFAYEGSDRKIFNNLTLTINGGEKIAVIGENGKGKSTLLKTLVGELPKLGGQFSFGTGVEWGYFDQQAAVAESQNPKMTIMEDFWEEYPTLKEVEVRSALGSFLFSGDDVYKELGQLSGGEKVRLALCKMFKRRPNLLILDEPTSSLTDNEVEALFRIVRDLKSRGVSLIYISHKMAEIREICDDITIMRDGTYVGSWHMDEISDDEIVKQMVGRGDKLFIHEIDIFPVPGDLGEH